MKSSVSCILQVIGTLGALGQVYVQSALAAVFSGGQGGIPARQQTHLQPAQISPSFTKLPSFTKIPIQTEFLAHSQNLPFIKVHITNHDKKS